MSEIKATCASFVKNFFATLLAFCFILLFCFASITFYEDEINAELARISIFDKYITYINNKKQLESRLDSVADEVLRKYVEDKFTQKTDVMFAQIYKSIDATLEASNSRAMSLISDNIEISKKFNAEVENLTEAFTKEMQKVLATAKNNEHMNLLESKNTIKEFSLYLDELKNTFVSELKKLHHLAAEKEKNINFEKKYGVDYDKFIHSLNLARDHSSKLNFDIAALYYTNAISANAADTIAIVEYISMLKNAAINNKDNIEISNQYIEAAINTLKNYASTTKTDNIPIAYEKIGELLIARDEIYNNESMVMLDSSAIPQACKDMNIEEITSNKRLSNEQKIYELNLLSNECSVFLNNLPDNSKLKLDRAKSIIENLKKDIFVIESIRTIDAMIDQAKNEGNADYAMNILSNIQNIFSGVFSVASESVRADVLSSYSLYKKTINDINEKHDSEILNAVDRSSGIDSIGSHYRASMRIEKYNNYINELNKAFTVLRSESSRVIAQEKIRNTEKMIINTQKNSIESYNRWAIERIDELYTHYDKNIDKLTKSFRKEDDIVAAINTYISNIDTGFLSHPVSQIYNEILSQLYGKLNTENKIKVSRMLNNSTKRGLD